MQVANNTVVTLHYRLSNDRQEEIDRSADGAPMVYLHGGGELIDGLEAALAGKQAGDHFTATIPPGEAYGAADPALIRPMHIDEFNGADMRVGMQLQGKDPDGNFRLLRVVSIDGDQVTIDMNHPLAGQTLVFAIEVVDVRAATPEEIEAGQALTPTT
ncbi:MAG: peptidylprolyl isomerase [Gammaproteobacteria bacterium]|jgi:FKBP-type peptidyl-prolyl cis-trans isomerase SlyD|nr:peptidylprolyl isomerase [Gammaproteobacteria bacterium]